jgi:hypothetical protein
MDNIHKLFQNGSDAEAINYINQIEDSPKLKCQDDFNGVGKSKI